MSDSKEPRVHDNLELVRRFFEEGVNRRAWEAAEQMLAPDVAVQAGSVMLLGWDEWKAAVEKILVAFPDAHVEIDTLTADGDRVAARLTLSGTQHGKFADVPPKLRRVSVPSAVLIQLRDRRVQSLEFYFDSAAVLQQITSPYPGGFEGNGKSMEPYPKR